MLYVQFVPNCIAEDFTLKYPIRFPKEIAKACESALQGIAFDNQESADRRARVIDTFKQTRFEEFGDFMGWRIVVPGRPLRETLEIMIPELSHPRRLWQNEAWRFNGKTYSFVNVGSLGLEKDAENLNRFVYKHLAHSKHLELRILFGVERWYDEYLLRTLRWKSHQRVLDNYERNYQHLSRQDFASLTVSSQRSSNCDILMLLDDGGAFDWNMVMVGEQIERIPDQLAQTLQISYYGERHIFTPSLRGVLAAGGLRTNVRADHLPFETRIDETQRAAFRRDFYKRFDRKTTAEFARYMHFGKRPPPLGSLLVLRAIDLAVSRGIKTIVASTKRDTADAFHVRYGFEIYKALPTGTVVDEYVSYLDLESPRVQAKLANLGLRAARVKVENRTHEFEP